MSGNVYLLSYGFNQDFSCFTCGTTAGFRVFMLDKLSEVHRREQVGKLQSCLLCTMLFKTNVFAIVESHASSLVHLWDDNKKNFVGEIRSRHEVKGVSFTRHIICVVSDYNIYAYTTNTLSVIFHIQTTGNPKGLCATASGSDPWVLACPGSSVGSVRIQVGPSEDGSAHEFTAHKTNLACLATNEIGTLFATASETGTVARVFNRTGECLHELRRGIQQLQISSLCFRRDDKYLACASSSATVHIFELKEVATTQNVSDALTAVMPKYFQANRAIAIFRIPDMDNYDLRAKNSNIVGPQVCFAQDGNRFYVLHYTGLLYEVRYDVEGRQPPSSLQRVVSQVPGSQHVVQSVFGDDDSCHCSVVDTTTWFAARPDFKLYRKEDARTDDKVEDDWNVI
eukprot:GEMP01013007.1.p1 GENE.GEMP01013007.1~~GEMP01013007.1.p1  ORF type:complete len:412 (+),score=60.61 GEMP01013007.1:47-1237(+)